MYHGLFALAADHDAPPTLGSKWIIFVVFEKCTNVALSVPLDGQDLDLPQASWPPDCRSQTQPV